MPRLSRAKNKSLHELLDAKQNLVGAIHPILLLGAVNPPQFNLQQCRLIELAATTLEKAIHDAQRYISDPQVSACLHSSQEAVAAIRQKIINWCDGDEYPRQLDVLMSAILPHSIMQADDFRGHFDTSRIYSNRHLNAQGIYTKKECSIGHSRTEMQYELRPTLLPSHLHHHSILWWTDISIVILMFALCHLLLQNIHWQREYLNLLGLVYT